MRVKSCRDEGTAYCPARTKLQHAIVVQREAIRVAWRHRFEDRAVCMTWTNYLSQICFRKNTRTDRREDFIGRCCNLSGCFFRGMYGKCREGN